MPVAEAITSVHLPHVQLMMTLRSTSFLLAHSLPMPLTAYYEGHGSLPELANVTWNNLSLVQPWAQQYAEAHLKHSSPIQRSYRSGQMKCVTGVIMRATGLCKDVLTVYKIAAIHDAVLERRSTSLILWLDVDAYFQRPLDAEFWNWATQFDVATIFRRGTGDIYASDGPTTPETGIMFFNAASAAAQFMVREAQLALHDETERLLASSVNDISIFNMLFRRADPRMTRLGRFAVGCRPPHRPKSPEWLRAVSQYQNDPRVVDCVDDRAEQLPAAASTVSPFNLFSYITHAKGNGPVNKGGLGISPHNAPGSIGSASVHDRDRRTRLFGSGART